jgi:hypothetical protein
MVLDIQRNDCQILKAVRGQECSIEQLSVHSDRTLVSIKSKDCHEIVRDMSYNGMKVRTARRGEIWVDGPSCTFCSFIAKFPFVKVMRVIPLVENRIQVHLVIPSRGDVRFFKSRMKRSGIDYTILSERPFQPKDMTDKEREVVFTALQRHFFDCENRTSLTTIAKDIGVSPSSLSETIRRGTKKAVVYYMENKK